ncbi:MAG: type II secretion system secretin GspD [Oligoflexia bacterium]|nr:type II secretion system secretin GspD [Oligoflexia bacterium]
MRHLLLMILFTLGIFIPLKGFSQQPPPPSFDNFLDEEDFDAPPIGAPIPPPAPAPAPAPDFTSGSSETSNNSFGKNSKPQPRRNRKENPPVIEKGKKSLFDATDIDMTDANFPDLIDSFDYPNAEISDIVKAISELTGKNFIIDQGVKGKITIIAPTRITVAEAYKAFLSSLAMNGFTVVPSGKFLKIKQAQNATRDNLDTYSGAYAPTTDAMITRIVQLKYISAKDVFNSLGPMLQSRLGELKPYEPTNTLIISDYGSNIDRIMKILRQLDVPGFEEQLEVIRVRHAKASELAKLVDQIINKGKPNPSQGGGFTTGIPRFNTLGSTQGSSSEAYSLVIPDERTNTLIVVGNTQGIDKIKGLVRKLDFKLNPEDQGGVYVYYVRFGDAEKISATLSGLAQQNASNANTPPNPFGAPAVQQKTAIFGGDVKVVADKTTNSLVVTASKQDYEVVKSILSKLDVPRDQVYVEGIIMELNVGTLKQWGINYYQLSGSSFAGRSGFASNSGAASSILDINSDKGAVLGFGGGATVSVTPPGSTQAISIPSLVGFINFLSSITNTNILSTPQIMALDNEEAEIEVGANVPVGSSSTQSATGTTTSQQREDVTIKLNIKPHISPGSNTMRLEITQSIKDISQQSVNAKNLSDNALAYTKRNTKTSVIVHDKDTIVIGGLMRDRENVSVTKVPLLGDIPILGWLFKGKKVEQEKVNLMMFLTPRIVRTSEASSQLVKDKMNERLNFIQRSMGGKDGQGDLIDQLKLKQKDNN